MSIYLVFAEILLILTHSFIYGLQVSYDTAFATKCVDDKYIFLKLLTESLDQCVIECVRRKECLAVDFSRRVCLCSLLSTDGSGMTLTSTDIDCVFVTKSGMRFNLPAGCQECKVGQNCDFENEKCTITECAKLSLDNGLLLGNMNGVGKRVQFTCNSGYRTETGEKYTSSTCKETGNWSIIPKCLKVRNSTKVLSVDNGGIWGEWGEPTYCPGGTFASGYSMKMAPRMYTQDDTFLNAIRLICTDLGGTVIGHITSLEGPFGSWLSEEHCANGTYLVDFKLQVEEFTPAKTADFDNTCANYVKYHCREIAGSNNEAELALPPGYGAWGNWSIWSESCGPNSAICGLSTRVEGDQGEGVLARNDDTSLNDVVFYCCDDIY